MENSVGRRLQSSFSLTKNLLTTTTTTTTTITIILLYTLINTTSTTTNAVSFLLRQRSRSVVISPPRLSSLRRRRGGGGGGITVNNSVGVEDSYTGIGNKSSIGRRKTRFSTTPFEKTIVTKRMSKSSNNAGDDGAASYSNTMIGQDEDDNDNAVKIPKSFRGVFVGSGSDGMSDPRIAKIILDLVPQNKKNTTPPPSSLETGDTSCRNHKVHVAYLGTATYDLPQFATRQTQCFNNLGCQVETLDLAHHHHHHYRRRRQNDNKDRSFSTKDDGEEEEQEEEEQGSNSPNKNLTEYARQVLGRADIIVVGGGNTLYAIDRWKELQVDKLLLDAMNRGVVLTGGSAGAICWFDGGHSDSCDPNSFYASMMNKFGNTHEDDDDNSNNNSGGGGGGKDDLPPSDESAIANDDDDDANKDWKYIRVPCLGFIPGLCCPHHDRVQSNGVLRADDFDEMLLRNYNYHNSNNSTQHSSSSELGIAIDHWAALVCCGEDDSYQVISLEGKKGSVLYNNEEGGDGDVDVDETGATLAAPATASFSRDASGVPGIWLKEVQDGKVRRQVLPDSGKLSQILRRRPRRSSSFIMDGIDRDAIEECRRLNQPWVDN